MKKLLSVFLCVAMLLTAAVVTISADTVSSDVTDDTWSEIELQALIYMQGAWCGSDLAEDYDYDEWYEVEELDVTGGTYETYVTQNMRGFAMSPDRKYAYLGLLNGGTAFRGCIMFNMETGRMTDCFYRYDMELAANEDVNYRFSFAKGVAADDRGYVYVGFALSANYNLVNLGIAKANYETEKLEEVYMGAVYEYGTPGDAGGIHVGVNGVDVAKVGDKYLCYVMINYDVDRLYCYDVTDPAHPELYKEFGEDGILDMGADGAAIKISDGDYLDVDPDGTIWLCAGDVLKIAPDGSALLASIPGAGSYCVCHAGSYVIVGKKDGSAITVYDDSTLEKITDIKYDVDTYGTRIGRVLVIDDILFATNTAENDAGAFHAIMAAALTPDAQAKLDEMVANLNGGAAGEDATEAPTETPTAAEEKTEAPTAAEEKTEAPTEAQGTTAATEADTKAAEKAGCKSVIGLTSVFALIIAGAGFMMSKKH